MYGLIGTMTAVAGQRDAVAAVLIAGFSSRVETVPLGGIGLPADGR